MPAATRIAVPRSLFMRGWRLKSSMMLAMMRCLRSPALINSSIVAQRLRTMARWKLFRPFVFCSNHASMAFGEVSRCGLSQKAIEAWFEQKTKGLNKPRIDGLWRGKSLRHFAGLVLQVEDHFVPYRFMKLVGVDVRAEDFARPQLVLVLEQQRRAGEADEDRVFQPALHLLVHIATLGAVAFIHEHVKSPVDWRRRTVEIGGVELVDQRAEQPGSGGSELGDELGP